MNALIPAQDHPRSRGVYTCGTVSTISDGGSSPLARGLPDSGAGPGGGVGIIPARAGFTTKNILAIFGHPDHPRSRGVYTASGPFGPLSAGSSPLARGLPQRGRREPPPSGIIPARAGFTPESRTAPHGTWDHPRSRGVYIEVTLDRQIAVGSSPLARGLREKVVVGSLHPGIIPARAGFTRSPRRGAHQLKDHPRSRGVYVRNRPDGCCPQGSSPLARGLRGRIVH